VYGPDIDPTFQSATLDFQLFDIPIEIDKAGNTTEKANLAWTFKASLESKSVKSEKKTEHVALDKSAAEKLDCPIASFAAP